LVRVIKGEKVMARKSLVVLTSAVGVAAVAAGAYIARHRRDGYTATGTSKAKPVATDWHQTEDALTEEFANFVREESVSAV
jgi:vacuolar-type H+-ATPase catalytic subunit A/Vma1